MPKSSTVELRQISAQEMRELAVAARVNVPIEQTWVWAEFEETFPDRELIGFFSIDKSGEPVAILGLTSYDYHGFNFAWAKHGPVWLTEDSAPLEEETVQAIVDWLKHNRPRTAFARLHLSYPGADAYPPRQITTYDRTVMVQLADNDADLMAGFKPRTRTMLRSAAKKLPVHCADETAQATADMEPYYAIMEETADRQGFTPWGEDVYEHLLETLTPEHARLFAARVDGELAAFAIFTLCGSETVYYYAAANELGRKNRAPAQLLYWGMQQLGTEGYTSMDLMGIGSDLAPSLDALTAFKSGFAKEISEVPPSYDIPVNRALFKALEVLVAGKAKVDSLKSKFLRGDKDE